MSADLSPQLIIDFSRYAEASHEEIQEDLGGFALEASLATLAERINPRFLKVVGKDVVDPKSGRSVFSFRPRSPLEIEEKRGATAFYTLLAEAPRGTLAAWISAPGEGSNFEENEYQEARVVVGRRISPAWIEIYGIPSHLSTSGCLDYAAKLASLTGQPVSFENGDQLRSQALQITIPARQNPWKFLTEIAPLDSPAWERIDSREVWQDKQEALELMQPIVAFIVSQLPYAKTERDFVALGATAEQLMEAAGFVQNPVGCNGVRNTDVHLRIAQVMGRYTVDALGNIRRVKSEFKPGRCAICHEAKMVGPCRICKACEARL